MWFLVCVWAVWIVNLAGYTGGVVFVVVGFGGFGVGAPLVRVRVLTSTSPLSPLPPILLSSFPPFLLSSFPRFLVSSFPSFLHPSLFPRHSFPSMSFRYPSFLLFLPYVQGGKIVVKVAPAVYEFDGTPVAGAVGQIGAGAEIELIGAKSALNVQSILEMMKRPDDGDGEGEDGDDMMDVSTADLDPNAVLEYANKIAKELFRACDAHHIQHLTVPGLSILVANHFKTSLSSLSELVEGQIVEARSRTGNVVSRLHYPARVGQVHDDGSVVSVTRPSSSPPRPLIPRTSFVPSRGDLYRSADITYDKSTLDSDTCLPREYIRDKKQQQHEVVLEEVHDGVTKVEMCMECLRNGCGFCKVGCSNCEADEALCAECRGRHQHWQSETRQCSRCEQKKLPCVRVKVYLIESDKEACNKKALIKLCSEGSRLHKHAFVIFGVQHALKSAAGPLFNWCATIGRALESGTFTHLPSHVAAQVPCDRR